MVSTNSIVVLCTQDIRPDNQLSLLNCTPNSNGSLCSGTMHESHFQVLQHAHVAVQVYIYITVPVAVYIIIINYIKQF